MKKKIIIIVAALLLIALVLTSIFVIYPALKSQSGINKGIVSDLNQENSILSCINKTDVDEYISKHKYDEHSFYYSEDDYYYFSNESVLNSEAEIEVYLHDAQVETIVAMIEVFYTENPNANFADDYDGEDDEIIEPESTEYIFNDDEKAQIEQSFDKLKKAFEAFFDCGEFKSCDFVPARMLEEGEDVPDDNNETFFRGFVIREYSLRDSDGNLWILRFEASNGSASAMLLKIVDETGYEDFLPIIDLTQNIQ